MNEYEIAPKATALDFLNRDLERVNHNIISRRSGTSRGPKICLLQPMVDFRQSYLYALEVLKTMTDNSATEVTVKADESGEYAWHEVKYLISPR